MSDFDPVHEQLRAIRSLMERATIYRAISAPTALIGGLLSLGGFLTAYYAKHHRHAQLTSAEFVIVWLVILALTGLSNLIFLRRDSGRRGEPFISIGMKTALASLAPAFLTAGILTCVVHRPVYLGIIWITLYGIGLLGTQHFAPRSLVALGLAFFLTGGALAVSWKHLLMPPGHGEPSTLVVSGVLAAIFGGYHLAYAAGVWALGEERVTAAEPLTESRHV